MAISQNNSTSKDKPAQSQSSEIAALNFKVPLEFKKRFKIAAVTHGITQSELLLQAFDEWQKKHR